MSEFVLPKRVVKSRIDSQVFSGSHASVMCSIRSCILFDLYTRLLYVLQPKEKWLKLFPVSYTHLETQKGRVFSSMIEVRLTTDHDDYWELKYICLLYTSASPSLSDQQSYTLNLHNRWWKYYLQRSTVMIPFHTHCYRLKKRNNYKPESAPTPYLPERDVYKRQALHKSIVFL